MEGPTCLNYNKGDNKFLKLSLQNKFIVINS